MCHNPNTGDWFDADTYGAAWSNLGMLDVGLVSVGPLARVEPVSLLNSARVVDPVDSDNYVT